MRFGVHYLIVHSGKKYGKPVNKARFKYYSTVKKVLKFPRWYSADILDKTTGVRRLPYGKQRRNQGSTVVPKSEAYRLSQRTRRAGHFDRPWEFRYEENEPYSVFFRRSTIFCSQEDAEATANFWGFNLILQRENPSPIINYPLKSCLKSNPRYSVSNREYQGYWFGNSFPTYIRGQARRQRERLERNKRLYRQQLFSALIENRETKVILTAANRLLNQNYL